MKLIIVTDKGTILGEVNGLSMYNLSLGHGQHELMEDVRQIILDSCDKAETEGEYVPTFSEGRKHTPVPENFEVPQTGEPVRLSEETLEMVRGGGSMNFDQRAKLRTIISKLEKLQNEKGVEDPEKLLQAAKDQLISYEGGLKK